MLRSPIRRALILSSLALPLALPAPASAHGPAECVAGPTRLASADKPPVVDVHGDNSPFGLAHGPAADVIGSWVTGPSAWEDRSSTEKVTSHMRVEALDRPPALARYYFVYGGPEGERWVRAVFDAPSSWSFATGYMNGTTYTSDGTTTGSVNTAAGVISIDLPTNTLPTRPADGSALELSIVAARSFLRHEPLPAGGGNLRLIDEATGGDCAVTLYEAAPIG